MNRSQSNDQRARKTEPGGAKRVVQANGDNILKAMTPEQKERYRLKATSEPQEEPECTLIESMRAAKREVQSWKPWQRAAMGLSEEAGRTPEEAKIEGLEEDLRQLIRVALTNPTDLRGFIQANYPKEYAEHVTSEPRASQEEVVERIRRLLPHCRPAHVTHQIEGLLNILQDAAKEE